MDRTPAQIRNTTKAWRTNNKPERKNSSHALVLRSTLAAVGMASIGKQSKVAGTGKCCFVDCTFYTTICVFNHCLLMGFACTVVMHVIGENLWLLYSAYTFCSLQYNRMQSAQPILAYTESHSDNCKILNCLQIFILARSLGQPIHVQIYAANANVPANALHRIPLQFLVQVHYSKLLLATRNSKQFTISYCVNNYANFLFLIAHLFILCDFTDARDAINFPSTEICRFDALHRILVD